MKLIQRSEHSIEPMEQSTRASIENVVLLAWRRKRLFSLAAIVTIAVAIAWALLATPIYRVTTSLMPRQGEQAGGLMRSLLGQYSGAAALLGLSAELPADSQEALAVLKSRAIFEILATQENLLPILFSDKWDEHAGRWKTSVRIPTMEDAWRMFDHRIRTVSQDKQTGVITLQISWRNRVQATQWTNALVKLVNEEMRQRALAVADATLTSLRAQYQSADSVELRNAIAQLMELQINKEAMAKSQPDYAFMVLDPARVPDANKFASPRRALIFIFALPLGIVVGIICVLITDALSDLIASLRMKAARQEYERST
jgi:uncharacterized protein involved in exopolysaccharide biosynthesis